MTKEEHITRAMLLGKVYDELDHTYCGVGMSGGPSYFEMLDADTLELLPVQGEDYVDGPMYARRKAVENGEIGFSK